MIYLKAFFAAWAVAAGVAIGWHGTSMAVQFLAIWWALS